ncbi:MAG: hypothetical protein KC994_06200 [Candidatus Omnitrophica bacterium]|nr:hypothetical protein [Candidatus Omnitrophota bacterium]
MNQSKPTLFIFILSFCFGVAAESPIHVGHPVGVSNNFVTFLNDLHPGNRIGYRIHEHLPLEAGPVLESVTDMRVEPSEVQRLIEKFSNAPGLYRIERPVTEEGWIPQDWEFYFAPVEDGIEVLWVVETKDRGLPMYYSAQQCFRMSGKTNADWRRKVAETPAFSEYDLWAEQEKEKLPLASLSYFRVGGVWTPFPPTFQKKLSRTPDGRMLEKIAGLTEPEVERILDPQHPADFIMDAENGLMTRTNLEGGWLSGLYWERTTHLSDHHPADCLHAIVNLGPIPPMSKRAIRGKIYWMNGDLEDLAVKWMSDFPSEGKSW